VATVRERQAKQREEELKNAAQRKRADELRGEEDDKTKRKWQRNYSNEARTDGMRWWRLRRLTRRQCTG
jgi:hypothetical protein